MALAPPVTITQKSEYSTSVLHTWKSFIRCTAIFGLYAPGTVDHAVRVIPTILLISSSVISKFYLLLLLFTSMNATFQVLRKFLLSIFYEKQITGSESGDRQRMYVATFAIGIFVTVGLRVAMVVKLRFIKPKHCLTACRARIPSKS